jgi:hypothetical protein
MIGAFRMAKPVRNFRASPIVGAGLEVVVMSPKPSNASLLGKAFWFVLEIPPVCARWRIGFAVFVVELSLGLSLGGTGAKRLESNEFTF